MQRRRRQWQRSKEKKYKPTSAKALRVFPPALPKAKCSRALPYLHFALMFSALPVGEPQQREPLPGRVKFQNLIRAAAPRGSAGIKLWNCSSWGALGTAMSCWSFPGTETPSQHNKWCWIPAAALYLFCNLCSRGWNHTRKFLKGVFWPSAESDNLYFYEQRCRKDCFPVWLFSLFFFLWFPCPCFPSPKSWGVFQTNEESSLSTLKWRRLLLDYHTYRNRFCK